MRGRYLCGNAGQALVLPPRRALFNLCSLRAQTRASKSPLLHRALSAPSAHRSTGTHDQRRYKARKQHALKVWHPFRSTFIASAIFSTVGLKDNFKVDHFIPVWLSSGLTTSRILRESMSALLNTMKRSSHSSNLQ